MKNRIGVGAAACAALALTLASCGEGSLSGGEPDGDAAGGLTEITVGALSIAPSSAVQYGLDNGVFADHGLAVDVEIGQGGAAMLPAVSAGTMDFAIGNPLSVLVAVDQGLDMRIVSGFSNSLSEGEDINGVIVRSDAGIESWSDLEGRTVSVNVLSGQGDLTIMEAVSQDGGGPDAVDFTEVAFPDAAAQLERGNIDAAWVPEPFLAQSLADDGFTLLGSPNQEVVPGLPTMVSFTSGSYADENPEIVEQFRAALTEALAGAQQDDEGRAAAVAEFLGIDEEAAAGLNMEEFDGEVRVEQLATMGELMVKYGFVDAQPDLSTVVIG